MLGTELQPIQLFALQGLPKHVFRLRHAVSESARFGFNLRGCTSYAMSSLIFCMHSYCPQPPTPRFPSRDAERAALRAGAPTAWGSLLRMAPQPFDTLRPWVGGYSKRTQSAGEAHQGSWVSTSTVAGCHPLPTAYCLLTLPGALRHSDIPGRKVGQLAHMIQGRALTRSRRKARPRDWST